MSELRDGLRARCESARARGVSSFEIDVEAVQRLITEADQLEHRVDSLTDDAVELIAQVDELQCRLDV